MATVDEIRNSLCSVIDPELGLSIIDLGLVYDIQSAAETVTITMTMTTPGCPVQESLTSAVKMIVGRLESGKRVRVNLVWEPPWTPEFMSEEAKRSLGW